MFNHSNKSLSPRQQPDYQLKMARKCAMLGYLYHESCRLSASGLLALTPHDLTVFVFAILWILEVASMASSPPTKAKAD